MSMEQGVRWLLEKFTPVWPGRCSPLLPEKRRLHVCETTHGAAVALYSDGTWDYLNEEDQ